MKKHEVHDGENTGYAKGSHRLFETYNVHALHLCEDPDALVESIKDQITVIATTESQELGIHVELPNVQAIVSFGAGIDNIDLDYAETKDKHLIPWGIR